MFTLHWTVQVRGDNNEWQWSSADLDEVFDMMYKTQISTHPDVIYIAIKKDGEMYVHYKGEKQ